jgi:tRNA threonylcarbamoyladenosine biosynthesis protein TsaB
MRIVAIETTELIGSVAAMEADTLVAELTLPAGQRSAESLAPTIARLLDQIGWKPQQIDLVAVSIGPGSFTGLRIGVTTAKALAYAVQAEVVGVSTLDAIACRTPHHATPLWAVSDAHRRQVFAGYVPFGQPGQVCRCDNIAVLTIDQWLQLLKKGDWVTGPGLIKYETNLPQTVQLVHQSLWSPTAVVVGRIGWHRYQAGHRDDLWQLVPCYIRKSAAEEKWQEGHGPFAASAQPAQST